MLEKCCGASHSGPLHGRATQLNIFHTFSTTDLEGRSGEQDGPRHTTLRPGSSGACASQGGRCWRSLSSCFWGWDCCSRWPCTLDFHRNLNSKYSASCCDQSLSHFGAASWWAGCPLRTQKNLNWKPKAFWIRWAFSLGSSCAYLSKQSIGQ